MNDSVEKLLGQRVFCGKLTSYDINEKQIVVTGWVYHCRDQGGIIFLDLRERSGVLQIVFDKSQNEDTFNMADTLRSEDVILIRGTLRSRSKETINPQLNTGEIELLANEIHILNRSQNLPVPVDEHISSISEENRLKHRYLDLRRYNMQNSILKRHEFFDHLRSFLNAREFWEVETPILNKSTPEGARDFLVPSRMASGNFYALPQSPQIFKQILMASQVEKYYQIARCFRDEDLRKDRQPEFTQLDIEMSFVNREQVMDVMEELITTTLKSCFGIDLKDHISRMSYHDAMENYGTDKPDIRFEMKMTNLDEWAKTTEFKIFTRAVEQKGRVFGLRIPKGGSLSRKDLDDLTEWVSNDFGAKGLAWIKHTEKGLESVLIKFIPEESQNKLIKLTGSENGDIILFGADKEEIVFNTLSNVRVYLAKKFKLIPQDSWKGVWITDFPLFYWDQEQNRMDSVHNPFTSPANEEMNFLLSLDKKNSKELTPDIIERLRNVKSKAYDLTLNGVEVAGGGIRVHNNNLQRVIFNLLGMQEQHIEQRFGFLLNALKYGAPPHGGIAFGLDRLLMLCLKKDSIREVIPFPKTQKGQCLMSDAPSSVEKQQLDDLYIKSIAKK